jgi:hypothetical protein
VGVGVDVGVGVGVTVGVGVIVTVGVGEAKIDPIVSHEEEMLAKTSSRITRVMNFHCILHSPF